MNLQTPLGCLHPDPTILDIDRALNDDLLDNDLHRKIPAGTTTNDFARLKVLSARCDPDVDKRAKTFHAFLTFRVTGPGDSLFLEDHTDIELRAADASVDRYFAMRPLLLTVSALAQLTTFTLLSLDFFLLSFCDV